MPTYQIYFDTQRGEIHHQVDIDRHETLREVMPEVLAELERNGDTLKGWSGGLGDVVCRWQGQELDFEPTLLEQGVRENDVLRVSVKAPPIQLGRAGAYYDIIGRQELVEGDDLYIGHTILRFHIKSQQRKINKNQTMVQRIQQTRSFQQTAYFMALVGAMAGIGCWFLLSLLQMAAPPNDAVYDLWIFTLLGALIGGLSVGFHDQMTGSGVVPRWVLAGIVIGAVTGALGGGASHLLKGALPKSALVAGVVSWIVAGALIGFATSLRWLDTNRSRVLHGLFGGLFGGLLGGLAYTGLALLEWGDWAQALGLALTGAGITLGISLAPILLRHGVLEFINSRDPGAKRKYEQNRKQWEIHQNARYVIGSLGAGHTTTMFAPELSIYIPDQLVEPRHAILSSRDGSYYIEPHPDLNLMAPVRSRIGQ